MLLGKKQPEEDDVFYHEVQGVWELPAFALILLAALAALIWFSFILEIYWQIKLPDGQDFRAATGGWLIFGILLPLLMLSVKLTTEVRQDGIYVRYFPFHLRWKKFLFKDISSYQIIRYQAMRRFGGWGIRFNFKGERAYSLSGSEGIELRLKSGRMNVIVIGSQRPHEFKYAIDSARGQTGISKHNPPV